MNNPASDNSKPNDALELYKKVQKLRSMWAAEDQDTMDLLNDMFHILFKYQPSSYHNQSPEGDSGE